MDSEEVVLESQALRLALRRGDGQLLARLVDCRSGRQWSEGPLARARVYEKMERRERRARWEVASIEATSDGCHVRFFLAYEEMSIGLDLRLDDGELVIRMPMPECYELRPRICRLMAVEILPSLLTIGAAGAILLPLHSGMKVLPADKPARQDRFMIYGQQSRWELLPTLPLCGATEADSGLLLLATAGAPETECTVTTDGRGSGSVAFAFAMRQCWPDPVCRDDREIRVVPFATRDSDLLHAAAHRLRRHIRSDLGKATLEQRAAESPQIQQLLESHLIRIFHGMQPIGMAAAMDQKDVINIREPFVVDTSFREAAVGLRRLHAAGVGRMHVESIGWNPRGHDGMWPSRFPIEPRLGGEDGFRELIRAGRELGCTMNVHDNYLSQYLTSPDFDPSIVMHDQWGQPDLRGFWGGGETYVTCPWALPEERLDGELRRVRALGVDGPAYIDGMGNPLECSYAPGPAGTRSDYVRGSRRILDTARRIHGAVRTECGFLYACLSADCLCQCGNVFMLNRIDPDWPLAALLGDPVPLWQLALHGLVVRENHGRSWRSAMDCILYGDHPRHEWSAHGRFQPALDAAHVAAIRAKYDLAVRDWGHLQTQALTAWSSPQPGVQETRFEDGTCVRADFNRLELWIDGQPIARPPGLETDEDS